MKLTGKDKGTEDAVGLDLVARLEIIGKEMAMGKIAEAKIPLSNRDGIISCIRRDAIYSRGHTIWSESIDNKINTAREKLTYFYPINFARCSEALYIIKRRLEVYAATGILPVPSTLSNEEFLARLAKIEVMVADPSITL